MKSITVSTQLNAPLSQVWRSFTQPEHIVNWNFASDDWECPAAENDLKVGGKFKNRMAAKDGSSTFDFEGSYTAVQEHKLLEFVIADGRRVSVQFEQKKDAVLLTERFEPEGNPL